MPNIVDVTYSQTGNSVQTDAIGMREMQQRAYAERNAQYLLLKAPPASGKSRALMFIALDKIAHQGIKKIIIAVPERAIGASFRETLLTPFGFFADWKPDIDLTGNDDFSEGKIQAFLEFIENDQDSILLCTHATLRFAFDQIEETKFDHTLLAIDEFHHVSSDQDASRLGNLIHNIMAKSSAHLLAMTGSYFRGDGMAVLLPEDEAHFVKVTYNYYDQLNGYTYLRSLGIGYHFYQGRYLSAIGQVLDTNKKTLIHIPSVNSRETTGDKYEEVNTILDIIGNVIDQDKDTGVITVRRHMDGKKIKVADLVEDDPTERDKIVNYLRNMSEENDIDVIIALGMAREGFDWPSCEHTLTVGYRGSLTEVVQIIGRCTRDSVNKSHAQFTNLIAQPDAEDGEVTLAVNDMLKAITCSLLMEQVLAPNFKFKTRLDDDTADAKPGEIKIRGFRNPSTAKVKQIIESDLNDLKAKILQDPNVLRALPGKESPEIINKFLIPRIIQTTYPELSDEEVEEVRQYVVADSAIKNSSFESDETSDRRFIRLAGRFININDLSIDLIDSINPFQKAYEILSKSLDARTFRLIQECVDSTRIQMTDELAVQLWPNIKEFVQKNKREPNLHSSDSVESQLASALIYLRAQRRRAGL